MLKFHDNIKNIVSFKDDLVKADNDISASLKISLPEYLVGVDENEIESIVLFFINKKNMYDFELKCGKGIVDLDIINHGRTQNIILIVVVNYKLIYGFDSFGKIYNGEYDNESLQLALLNSRPLYYNGNYYNSIFEKYKFNS